jgi:hypothetical protein
MAACTGIIAMDAFRFSPELFEYRTDIISKLQEHGFDWLTHYGSVDPLHDVFGMEVCGIRETEDAVAILKLLTEMYPSWRARQPWYHEGSRDRGCGSRYNATANHLDNNGRRQIKTMRYRLRTLH